MANRLTSSAISNNAVIPLSTCATYAYNAQGQRVTRVEDEVITHFYYTGSALLFTTVNEYVLQTQNILDPSGTIVASKRFEGQAATGQDPYADDYFFYRYDVRGSVTNIVDGEGAVVKSYDYDEFGVTTSTGDTFFNEVTFTGSVADASGLLYMNARYYNPATARFLSQDTYTGSASVPWTQHLYAYCNNNPVNMVDPTGHMAGRPCTVNINDGGSGLSSYELMERSVTPEPQPSPEKTPSPAAATPQPSTTPIPTPGPTPRPHGVPDPLSNYTWFLTIEAACNAWADTYRPLSADVEYCAFIYERIDSEGNVLFTYGETRSGSGAVPALGIRDNVVGPFISMYLFESVASSRRVGFIHTHPDAPANMTVRGASNEDLFLLNLPGIDFIAISPYEFEYKKANSRKKVDFYRRGANGDIQEDLVP